MSYKEHIPRFFLYCGSILIFISIFLEYEIITNTMTDETTTDYGYNNPPIVILFLVSLIPIILYEKKIKNNVGYILIIFLEIIIWVSSLRMHILIYSVETGIGFYFAMIGGLFQLIGILLIIIIEQIKRKKCAPDRPLRTGRG